MPTLFQYWRPHDVPTDIPEEMIMGNNIVKVKRLYTRNNICQELKVIQHSIELLESHIKDHKLHTNFKEKRNTMRLHTHKPLDNF